MCRKSLVVVAILQMVLLGSASAQEMSYRTRPIRAAVDVGYAPFGMRQPDGQVVGFVVDMGQEIAKRVGSPGMEILDVKFSAIFAGLYAGNYDMILTPLGISAERAKEMLFTEGYLQTGLGFLASRGNAQPKTVEDVRGKRVAVNRGTTADRWASENEASIQLQVQRYDNAADAAQAVVTRRADYYVNDIQGIQYAATRIPNTAVAFRILQDRVYAMAFRPSAVQFRNAVEDALECIKRDGTLSRIHAKWLGEEPPPDSHIVKVAPGFGPEGLQGFQPRDSDLTCPAPSNGR